MVESLFSQGLLVNAVPDGPVNRDPEIDGLRAAGVVVNCPPVFVGASSLTQRETAGSFGIKIPSFPNGPWCLPWGRLNATP